MVRHLKRGRLERRGWTQMGLEILTQGEFLASKLDRERGRGGRFII